MLKRWQVFSRTDKTNKQAEREPLSELNSIDYHKLRPSLEKCRPIHYIP